MELTEPIENINKRLVDFFGKFETGDANFRIVWSDDQFEKQLTDTTPEGFLLPYKVLREVPKYRQYIQHKYILERIVPVPFQNEAELTTTLSYEPIWVFEDANGIALPPKWEVINILVRTLLDQQTYKHGPYKMPESEYNTIEAMEEKARLLEQSLFGNESRVGDALAHGDGVGYTTSKILIH